MSAPSAWRRGVARAPRHSAKILRLPISEGVRRRRRRRLIALLVVVIILAGISVNELLVTLDPVSVVKPKLRPSAIELRLFRLVNDARARAGLPALAFSRSLMAATHFHSADMAFAGYLGYDGPAGDSPADRVVRAGLDYRELAENCYRDGSGSLAQLANRTLAQWLARPAYRGNLLSPGFRATAIAAARSADGSIYLTQDFIR